MTNRRLPVNIVEWWMRVGIEKRKILFFIIILLIVDDDNDDDDDEREMSN